MESVHSFQGDGMVKKKSKKSVRSGDSPPDIPEAELEVLACLWNAEAFTAAEIRDHLHAWRPMAHGSVLTLLNRLSEKGLVLREKSGQGKSFAYRAAQNPAAIHQRILAKLRQRIFGGSALAMVASLLESQPTSAEELRELKLLLEQFEKRNKSKGK
ncbi:MAG: BlaI/MecI/CopY family transcriptional regulator [Planctomycetaceae bacterium]